jgi:hypothetical protein
MNKATALSQIVRVLALAAEYGAAADIDRQMAALSIISDLMEEAEITSSDIESLLSVLPEIPETEAVDTPSLRDRIESMLNEADDGEEVHDEDDEDEEGE